MAMAILCAGERAGERIEREGWGESENERVE